MLQTIITDKIKSTGPLSFVDYMDLALYYPGHGYYNSGCFRTGKKADYFTGPTLTWLYGHMIAKQIEDMWSSMNENKFTIVEYGAGSAVMAMDILFYLKRNLTLYDQLEYFIIEKNESANATHNGRLHEKVKYIRSIKEIAPVTGCILSNELLDNFPVHRVVMQDQLMEIFVGLNEAGKLEEIFKPAGENLHNYLGYQHIKLPGGAYGEINLAAAEWIKEIAKNLKKGYILTIDYGGTGTELYNKFGKAGTLHCYNSHIINRNFYDDIGLQDITAYVNFSALHFYGLQHGLHLCGYTNQSRFLHSLGFADYVKEMETDGKLQDLTPKEKVFLINALFYSMGQQFRVLIQQKALPVNHRLKGLRFSSGNEL